MRKILSLLFSLGMIAMFLPSCSKIDNQNTLTPNKVLVTDTTENLALGISTDSISSALQKELKGPLNATITVNGHTYTYANGTSTFTPKSYSFQNYDFAYNNNTYVVYKCIVASPAGVPELVINIGSLGVTYGYGDLPSDLDFKNYFSPRFPPYSDDGIQLKGVRVDYYNGNNFYTTYGHSQTGSFNIMAAKDTSYTINNTTVAAVKVKVKFKCDIYDSGDNKLPVTDGSAILLFANN